MFEGITNLQELNLKRKELIASGVSVTEVNSEYNKAKQSIIQAAPSYKKPPIFYGDPKPSPFVFPLNINRESTVASWELVVQGELVSL